MVKTLRRKGNSMRAQLLLCIVSAGMWTTDRIKSCGYGTTGLCPLCGEAPDTEMHRVWDLCICVRNANLPEVRDTAHLEDVARRDALTNPAFWLRGLVPLPMLHITSPDELLHVRSFGAVKGHDWEQSLSISAEGLLLFLDESGGQYASVPLLRRCGWGLAVMRARSMNGSQDVDFLGGFAGTLPGQVQTPSRACLFGFDFALRVCGNLMAGQCPETAVAKGPANLWHLLDARWLASMSSPQVFGVFKDGQHNPAGSSSSLGSLNSPDGRNAQKHC